MQLDSAIQYTFYFNKKNAAAASAPNTKTLLICNPALWVILSTVPASSTTSVVITGLPATSIGDKPIFARSIFISNCFFCASSEKYVAPRPPTTFIKVSTQPVFSVVSGTIVCPKPLPAARSLRISTAISALSAAWKKKVLDG